MINLKQKLKKTKIKTGFTLIETVVSIAIFGIVMVAMTGIVLNLMKISVATDRRNDFLSELNIAVTNIKNELRNSETVNVCRKTVTPGSNRLLYYVKKDSAGQEYARQLGIEGERLSWRLLEGVPGSTNVCDVNEAIAPQFLTTDTIKIDQLTFNTVNDSADVANYLIYTSFRACDSERIRNKIFNCSTSATASELNPYYYMFAITSRNI